MDPGLLNCVVTIKRPGTTQDAAGQPSTTAITVATGVHARIRSQGGTEMLKAGAMTSSVPVVVTIRRRSGINAGMWFEYRSTTYRIVAVPPPGSNRQYMDFSCEAINGQS